MARLDIPPTRSNQVAIRNSLNFAQEGFDLLEQKRQILVIELMGRLETAKQVQKEVDEHMAVAYDLLKEAALTEGTRNMARAALAISLNHQIRIDTETLMGLRLPHLETKLERPKTTFGTGGTSALDDKVLKSFNDALESVARLAQLQTSIFRIARELRKTQSRVNALENVFLPNYRDTLDYIQDTIDERERDAFIVMKILKDRKKAQRANEHASPQDPC